ncbi:MAG: hypothetical protein AAB873_03355, partial [Patescibacteria group bacterium]
MTNSVKYFKAKMKYLLKISRKGAKFCFVFFLIFNILSPSFIGIFERQAYLSKQEKIEKEAVIVKAKADRINRNKDIASSIFRGVQKSFADEQMPDSSDLETDSLPLEANLEDAISDDALIKELELDSFIDEGEISVENLSELPLGKLLSLKDESISYLSESNSIFIKDSKSEIQSITFNALDLPVTISDLYGGTDIYEYEYSGKVTKFTDREGLEKRYIYDDLGRVSKIIYKDSKKERAVYQDFSVPEKIISKILPAVFADEYEEIIEMSYDEKSRLAGVKKDGGEILYSYDENDRPITSADSNGGLAEYLYDINGNILNKKLSSFFTQNNFYGYDVHDNQVWNRIEILEPTSSKSTKTLEYFTEFDESGNILNIENKDTGFHTKYIYTKDDHFKGVKTVNTKDKNVFSSNYSFDANLRWTTKTEAGFGEKNIENYGYDETGRLTQISSNGDTTNFFYDEAGNRIKQERNTKEKIYSYDGNRLTNISSEEEGSVSYLFDKNGSVVSKQNLSGTVSYGYNADNLLLSVSESGFTATYSYDGIKRISERNINGKVFRYSYEGGNLIAVSDAEGKILKQYFYDGQNNVLGVVIDKNVFHFIKDA